MAEINQVKSKRDSFSERLKGKYPDRQFDDDEAMFGQINDDYDQYDRDLADRDKQLSDYQQREQAFSDMFTSDPRSAHLMMKWKDGADLATTLMELYGDEIFEARNDPDRLEAIAEANKKFMERTAKEKEYEEQHSTNLQQSLDDLGRYQKERGLSDDQIDQAMSWIIGIAKDAMLGKFAPETIEMAINAQNFDSAVEQAATEGEVRGKNARVEEKLRKPQRGDGTVSLDGKNGGGSSKPMPDMGAIDRYGEGNLSIFERGGEKRTPVKR